MRAVQGFPDIPQMVVARSEAIACLLHWAVWQTWWSSLGSHKWTWQQLGWSLGLRWSPESFTRWQILKIKVYFNPLLMFAMCPVELLQFQLEGLVFFICWFVCFLFKNLVEFWCAVISLTINQGDQAATKNSKAALGCSGHAQWSVILHTHLCEGGIIQNFGAEPLMICFWF